MSQTGHTETRIGLKDVVLEGILTVPENAHSIVLFVHGSGSSRYSRRNRHVARVLQSRGIATLLFDLLTGKEEEFDAAKARLRFDIPFLTKRLIETTAWTLNQAETRNLGVGYFGASSGAAAALVSCAELRATVGAVVSRGGRPDLADPWLGLVRAPTLLIVGEKDRMVLELNRSALQKLRCSHKNLAVVPGATHLFEEPGALDHVANLAADWFQLQYLGSPELPLEKQTDGRKFRREIWRASTN